MKLATRQNENAKVPWYKSFLFTIIIWFFPLALIPILVIIYDSNKTIIKNIEESYYNDIKQVSSLESRFINNWFKYREIDIKAWAEVKSTKELLKELIINFQDSSQDLTTFVKSGIYRKSIIVLGGDFYSLSHRYDYIEDIFLIDTHGNILFSVEKKSDLSTNILEGANRTSKFAEAVKKTLKDKNAHFSDLEHYKPASNAITGFFTVPVFNDVGENIGVIAVGIKLNIIYALFENHNEFGAAFHYYLVGSDSLLRSKIVSDKEILNLKITKEQFNLLHESHKEVNTYINPIGSEVFGIHKDIYILGIHWVLISEADRQPIEAATQKIIIKGFIYLLITLCIMFIVAFFISKKIAKPVLQLSELMLKFSSGERDLKVDISVGNEIGTLANRFKEMMKILKSSEKDLREQKDEAKRALQELEVQKHVLDLHTIVAITDVKGSITFVNDKFVDISGYSREELIGQNHRLLNSNFQNKAYWANMYKDISSGKVWHGEVRNVTKHGTFYWVNTTIVPYMNEQGKPKSYIAIRTDVTDRKKAEIKLLEAKELAEESVKAKSEFLASMSHEIRTPMNGVIGMLGLLMHTELNESQRHQAYLAQSSATALLTLINDILDFSKVEAGKLELDSIDFNIHKELGDFAEAIAFGAQEKGVEVVLDISKIDIDFIHADVGRIRQILNNIVGNSIKFTSKGYIAIEALLHDKNESNTRLIVNVKDTGIGIPTDKIAKLFDSFSQVDTSTTRKYGGTGLGLAIVKKLCKLMDGEVRVSSTLGEGSTFTIDIHVEVSKKASIVQPSISVNGKKAMIVDASDISTQTLQSQLENLGMQVYHVKSSQEALILEDESFDIAFIDKDIKEISAENLAIELKNNSSSKSIKLVIMTSVSDRRDINVYREHGYDAYFPKPATTSDIFNSLNVLSYNALGLQDTQEVMQVKESKTYEWPENVRILLVDDNKVNQLVANGLLEEFKLEADVVNNGAEAIEALKNSVGKPYSIILMDCQMPIMDGYEASTKIKAGSAGVENAQIPIVAMTANAMDGDKEKCFIAGMDDYISKPINPDILEEKLRKYLLKSN